MDNRIRIPKQERSILKKEKIINAAYELFSQGNYYSITTQDIAKKAGVSTGIVYGYFKDKRDILSYVLIIYINKVCEPVLDYFNKNIDKNSFSNITNDILDLAFRLHKENSSLHNLLHSLQSTDESINEAFMSLEKKITITVSNKLESSGFNINNINEKVHISMNLIQNYSHESIYDKHEFINYSSMKNEIINIITNLFK